MDHRLGSLRLRVDEAMGDLETAYELETDLHHFGQR